MSLSFTTSSLSSSRSMRIASVYSFCRSKAWSEPPGVKTGGKCSRGEETLISCKEKDWIYKTLIKKQNCGLRGRTPIFLSFHSTVSCRSDISLTKPSCFMRSWRISWAAGKGDRVWSVEWESKKRKVTHAFVLCVKGESCETQRAASKSGPLC